MITTKVDRTTAVRTNAVRTPAVGRVRTSVARQPRTPAPVRLRAADASDAARLHALITANIDEGHLLPRTLDDLVAHAERFVIAVRGRTIIGCAELAPLSPQVAEVRSLAVDGSARTGGVGSMLVDELRRQARRAGFEKLCAFTASPGYFIRMGFSIVPHLWVPEKIFTNCTACPLFRRCGKYAMIVSLGDTAHASVTSVAVQHA
jgi:amino-acid N-acetyltransferase